MSDRERCHAMIDSFTEEQLSAIAAMLASARLLAADELADDAFCQRLYEEYEAEADNGERISIEDLAKELGISL